MEWSIYRNFISFCLVKSNTCAVDNLKICIINISKMASKFVSVLLCSCTTRFDIKILLVVPAFFSHTTVDTVRASTYYSIYDTFSVFLLKLN